VPRGKLFGVLDLNNVWAMYSLVFAVFVGGFLLTTAPCIAFGQVLKAIRETSRGRSRSATTSTATKLLAYVLSRRSRASPERPRCWCRAASFTRCALDHVGEVVLMCCSEGSDRVRAGGGALIIISMENYLAQIGFLGDGRAGRIFVICVLTFRRGVIGELGRLIGSRSRNRGFSHLHKKPASTEARRGFIFGRITASAGKLSRSACRLREGC